jgi:hypothetical protein
MPAMIPVIRAAMVSGLVRASSTCNLSSASHMSSSVLNLPTHRISPNRPLVWTESSHDIYSHKLTSKLLLKRSQREQMPLPTMMSTVTSLDHYGAFD